MLNTIIIMSIAVNVLLAAIVILLIYKVVSIEKRHQLFVSKIDGSENIEELFKNYVKMVNNVNEENKIIKSDLINLGRQVDSCSQNIGIVRYNAFDNVGNELSFAIAVLDNKGDGYIINSVYGTTSCNVYTKPVENGASSYPLSDEEKKALNTALNNKKL